MSEKKFFIYDRREIMVLVLLGIMIAVFAFTLGIHLGKKVGIIETQKAKSTHLAKTTNDRVPGRVEITENEKGALQAVDELLNEKLHEEVSRTGIRLDSPRQVVLPAKSKTKNAGATTLKSKEKENATQQAENVKKAVHKASAETELSKAGEKINALAKKTPTGRYTLQVGSYPSIDEAGQHIGALESLGMQPFLRPALVKGGRWYRIYLGGFGSKKEAEKIAQNYIKKNIINSFVVAKMPSKNK